MSGHPAQYFLATAYRDILKLGKLAQMLRLMACFQDILSLNLRWYVIVIESTCSFLDPFKQA